MKKKRAYRAEPIERVRVAEVLPRLTIGCTRVAQWCFAAASTVEPTLPTMDVIELFSNGADHKLKAEVRKLADRWLGDVERRLERPRVDRLRRFHGGRGSAPSASPPSDSA
jgi:hypothetical protein